MSSYEANVPTVVSVGSVQISLFFADANKKKHS